MNLRRSTFVITLVLAMGVWAFTQNQPTSQQPASQNDTANQRASDQNAAQRDTVSDRTTVTVPTGTKISVRNDEPIDSQNTSPGQTFPATVIQAVEGDAGEVLIPKESSAELVIREIKSGGTTGTNQLVVDLESITVNGHRYRVSTEDVAQSGKQGIGKNRRTGEMVGGGAVLGTLIGAIAGGGKGAAIGAIAGGGAGGAAQVLTRGKTVKVPVETVLSFQLDRPLHLVKRDQ